ncbi:ThuA domain-containing protein [Saccharothrix sp.]|uniref:ThuA domain-containing protein n=1 Tax=Saccharothrix sp. TaxID=1873460 RepID=UPI0028127265|nr:ThuA domain-containing protein [Saccharothrix sp.]
MGSSSKRGWRRWSVAAVVVAVLAALAPPAQAHPGHGDETFKALVFSKTAGFRHPSIETGVVAIEQLGEDHGFTVDHTEDAAAFTDANLAQYEVVVFLSTTGDVLDADQQAAFERYIKAGGGYAGVHAAADTEYDWAWYGDLVGAYFKSHPAQQDATVKVTDPAHPATSHLPQSWRRFDEWYDFRSDPSPDVHVLAEMDETSYSGGTMGSSHPIAWCQDYDGGRSWYTGLGHTNESYTEPAFLTHLLKGLQTAAGVVDADCTATRTNAFEKVTLDDTTANPMELAIADDGRVFYIDRNGAIRIVRRDGAVVTAGTVNVYTGQEFGLLGIALDPNFATNNHLYLYYSPAGAESVDRVSRFTLQGDTIVAGSEKVVLTITTQRQQCCHAGGALEFDNDGNLYITTGDNTNPFNSDGYTPIDETAGRAPWDAQRSSANSNNLNGKILRITPQADGTYTIPAGNMFPPGTDKTRPEIYAMGFRNPFRIGLDPLTNKLQVADYGPDAGSSNPQRGPDGRVEWNIVDRPGFYGWPYCVGDNTPYVDYDFATGVSGAPFDCAKPVNNSPNNTGITELPAAIGTKIWQGKTSTGNPEIGGSGAPMAGGTYRYDPQLDSPRKWPAYWDGKAIWGDWNDGRLFSLQLNAEGTSVADISRMLPGMAFNRVHAMQFGPDGALYVIEWGSGFGGNNADSGVYRIDYVRGDRAPIAAAKADKTSGHAPLTVRFDSAGSRDPDGDPLTFAWDFDGDGTTDSTDTAPSHTYTVNGDYTARLTVTDGGGRSAVANVRIVVGNTPPVVTLTAPTDGGFIDFGDQVSYKVTVTDAEDGTIDCQQVIVQPALGHDEHSHGYEQYRGCEGLALMSGDEGHVGANIFGVLTAKYTDKGGNGASPLTGESILVLQPKHKEAEYYTATGRTADGIGEDSPGVQRETTSDTGGGQNIGFITDGDWFSLRPATLQGIDQVRFRVAGASGGGRLEVRAGAPDGPLAGTATFAGTGGWQTWTTVTADIADDVPSGSELFFVIRRPEGTSTTGYLANLNWVEFAGRGVTHNQRPVVTASASPNTGTAPLKVDFTASATDPDGDTPISYTWVFGDGGTATGASVSHTYTAPGTFTAKVTATDSRGASGSTTVAVTVRSPDVTCFAGRSDDFLGTALDRNRWTTVVRENQELSVRDGKLVIPSASSDIYAGTNNTPNIVLQDLPSGPFQATAKVHFPARRAYQQAGLVIYGDDDNYAKMVIEGRSDTDDAANRIFQFIREEAGQPNEVGESNTAPLGAAYPDTVWVRFTSDGQNLTASYSADGQSFTAMPQTKALAGMVNPKVGLLSLVGGGGDRPVIDAEFDWFTLVPDDTAAVDPNDDFTGTSLDGCRWNAVVRPDPTRYAVTDGGLRIDTSNGDIYGGATDAPGNFILQRAPEGDWVIETEVDASAFDERYQQAGLIAYRDDANYVKLDQLAVNEAGTPVQRAVELRTESGDVVGQPQPSASVTGGVWHLRLAKSGSTYTGSYSADGQTWTSLEPVVNESLAGARIGVFALGGAQTASKPAKFNHFRIVTDRTAPVLSVVTDPASPGAGGWWTAPVTVTASATDNQPGAVRVEYKVGAGDWVAYTTPLSFADDGERVVTFRATDAAGNVSAEQSTTVKVDRTAPRLTVKTDNAPGPEGWWTQAALVSATATDDTSGGTVLEHRVDGGPWRPYTGPVSVTDGTHRVAVRATDAAGNTSAEQSVEVKVDTAPPVTKAERGSSASRVKLTASDATSGVARTEYRISGGKWQVHRGGEIKVRPDGKQYVEYRSIDAAGNVEAIGRYTPRKGHDDCWEAV